MATIQKKKCRGHTYWQIVESRRINGKPRPVVLMHLGTAQSLLRRLQEGDGLASKVRITQFGALAALWNLASELDIIGIIDRHVPKRAQGLSVGQYLLLAALNRCVAATSKASLYKWYRKTVLHWLMPCTKRALASQRFWDHMDSVDAKSIAAIEQDLTALVINRFHIDLRTLLFDATNFDTFIDTQTDCDLAQRGHAKSKRNDLRIIGLALLVSTEFNIPLLSHVYPGNQNDTITFAQATESLANRLALFAKECEHITLVFDGGNTSEDNMHTIDATRYHFITSLTLTHHQDLLQVPLRRFEAFDQQRLKGTSAYRTTKEIWGQRRTVIVTRSQNLLNGQLAGIATALRKKRTALLDLRQRLYRSQQPGARGKGYTAESLQKRLNTITSGQYVSDILKTQSFAHKSGRPDFRFYTDQHAFAQLKTLRLGKRILCTDNHEWTTEEIILGSRAQFHVENAFKQMKDPHWVRFSPAFHWTEHNLRVHAFYCVLALLFSSLLQLKASRANVDLTVNALLKELTEIKEVINLRLSQGDSRRGRPRAEYVISERSKLQAKLSRIFDIDSLAHR